MNYLLDTCVISDYFKKIPSVITHFASVSPSQIHISTVTIMEIEYGLQLHLERGKKIRPLWESLQQQINVLPLSLRCAKAAGFLRAQLKAEGALIGPYDILIAGTALANAMTIVSSNLKEFKRVPDLTMEDWRTHIK